MDIRGKLDCQTMERAKFGLGQLGFVLYNTCDQPEGVIETTSNSTLPKEIAAS